MASFIIASELRRIAAAMSDMATQLEQAAALVGDGSSQEDAVAAIIQLALARRVMERALADSGDILDRVADSVSSS